MSDPEFHESTVDGGRMKAPALKRRLLCSCMYLGRRSLSGSVGSIPGSMPPLALTAHRRDSAERKRDFSEALRMEAI